MKNRCIQSALIIYILLSLSFPVHARASSNPVINEFLARPNTGNKEWVELYNPDKTDLSNDWIDDDTSFTNDDGNSSKKSLANLIASDSGHPYIELSSFLNNSGDHIVLFDSTGNIFDEYEYSDDPGVDIAIGRSPDGAGEFQTLAQSTKGSANSQPQPTRTPQPTNTPIPTNTPKPPTPTKTPIPMTASKVPTLAKTSPPNPKNTLIPTRKLPSISATNKKLVLPTKIASRSALGISTKSATLTPKKEAAKVLTKASTNTSFLPLIFTIVGAVIFTICAILVALKIKWKQQ